MTLLAVAALSARMLAEAARADGFDVVALDCFGDADTRRASAQWVPIGAPGALRIDAALLLEALSALAQRGDAVGWIAGSGFDGQPDLLARGAALLPLIGTPADAVRRVRDPQAFFELLDGLGIPHPPVSLSAPVDAAGWLVKDASGCGGWHIRRAAVSEPAPVAALATEPAPVHHYFQREVPGAPMSATFIANGSDARVLGFNQLTVRRFGARPFVFCGAIGPVPLPPDVAQRIDAAVRALAAAFALRGLGSLDFMFDGTAFSVLEINPRPPASMALYGQHHLVAAHLRACLHDELPPDSFAELHLLPRPSGERVGVRGSPGQGGGLRALTPTLSQRERESIPKMPRLSVRSVHGTEIVFAPRPIALDAASAQRLGSLAGCHDLPATATRFDTADPVCSVSAQGETTAQVSALLARRSAAVHQFLETLR